MTRLNRSSVALVLQVVFDVARIAGLSLAVAVLVFPFGEPMFLLDFFSVSCHQLPDRSLSFAGSTFPICARCMGLYLGFAASMLSKSWIHSFGLFFGVMAALELAGKLAGTDSSNVVRLFCGFFLAVFVCSIVGQCLLLFRMTGTPPNGKKVTVR